MSRRQLERLFQKHLKCVPSRYYLELRLNRARQLLLQTNLSIIDVSLACGFVSAPHFSKCYRDFFGIPPREERRRFSPGQSVRAAEQSLKEDISDDTPNNTPEDTCIAFDVDIPSNHPSDWPRS